jgi:hypothetical protein
MMNQPVITDEQQRLLINAVRTAAKYFAGSGVLPHEWLKPKVMPDETKWLALYGPNLREGIVGYGD